MTRAERRPPWLTRGRHRLEGTEKSEEMQWWALEASYNGETEEPRQMSANIASEDCHPRQTNAQCSDQVAVLPRVSYSTMDDSQSLDALSNAMNSLEAKPLDFDYHVQHIRLAESLPGMEAHATVAREMMSQFLAVGDDVWLPLLDHKESSVDLETETGVTELLTLYERAEADYLCE